MIGALNNATTGLSLPPARADQAEDTVNHTGHAASREADSEPRSGNASLAAPITGSPVNAVPPVEAGSDAPAAERGRTEQSYREAAKVANDTVNPPDNLLDVLR